MTELDAVNQMLSYLADPPVSSLASEEIEGTEAAGALAVLRESSRTLQSQGWSFNREHRVLSPDAHGRVLLPESTLRFQATATRRYLQRSNQLYDRLTNAYEIREPVDGDLILELPFDALPDPVARFITVSAGRRFASRSLGAPEIVNLIAQDEHQARRDFMEYELEQDCPNFYSKLDQAHINREISPHDYREGLREWP